MCHEQPGGISAPTHAQSGEIPKLSPYGFGPPFASFRLALAADGRTQFTRAPASGYGSPRFGSSFASAGGSWCICEGRRTRRLHLTGAQTPQRSSTERVYKVWADFSRYTAPTDDSRFARMPTARRT